MNFGEGSTSSEPCKTSHGGAAEPGAVGSRRSAGLGNLLLELEAARPAQTWAGGLGRHPNPPSVTGGSGSPRTSPQPPHAAALFSCHLSTRVKVKPQCNGNSGAQYPIRRTAIHQMVRDKKHKRFSVNVETKMNINFQSSTKTMGSRETDITNSPYSIRLGSHLPQTPIANLDLKDKSSCRRALPLSCPLMPLLKMLLQFGGGGWCGGGNLHIRCLTPLLPKCHQDGGRARLLPAALFCNPQQKTCDSPAADTSLPVLCPPKGNKRVWRGYPCSLRALLLGIWC